MNLNQLLNTGSDYPSEKCGNAVATQPASLLANLLLQRDIADARLTKIEAAIAALEANPEVADLIQKLGAI